MERADVLELKEVRAMMAAAMAAGRTRDALLIGLGAAYGLRIGDLLALTWGTILDEAGRPRAWVEFTERKNRTRRVCRTPNWLLPVLDAYINEVGAENIDPNARIFHISRVRAWQILKAWAEACGVRKRISPHSLRKCFCTTIYRLTRDPVLACQFTGHKNAANLLRYIGYPSPTVERIWARFAEAEEDWEGAGWA